MQLGNGDLVLFSVCVASSFVYGDAFTMCAVLIAVNVVRVHCRRRTATLQGMVTTLTCVVCQSESTPLPALPTSIGLGVVVFAVCQHALAPFARVLCDNRLLVL